MPRDQSVLAAWARPVNLSSAEAAISSAPHLAAASISSGSNSISAGMASPNAFSACRSAA